MEDERDETNDSPIEEVRLTVPITDDHTLPAFTFRTWAIGLTTSIGLAFLQQFSSYRQNSIYISLDFVQIIILPLGKVMAAILPTKSIRIPWTKWAFTLNPGPFNVKEHVLITIFANQGLNTPLPVAMMTMMKAFFHIKFHPMAVLLLSFTSQLVGYGFVGLFVKLLVDPPRMWWPQNLVKVSLFRTLHETDERLKGQLTRFQFFLVAAVSSFAYYIVPNYFFPSITALSFVCWIWKSSVTAQQIGSGRNGLGLGSFMLDYSTILAYVGNPFATPVEMIVNTMVGFFLVVYVLNPIAYWTNSFSAKKFPIFSSHLFDANGHVYNVSRVLDTKTLTLDEQAYNDYSKIYLSVLYAIGYGFGFAATTATFTHIFLFHGRSIWRQIKEAYSEQDQNGDIHNRLMRKYEPVPKWWYHIILISTVILAVLISTLWNQFQLPVWGVLLSIGLSLVSTLSVGVILATTGLVLLPTAIQDLMIGYLLPGKPLAIMTFGTYGLSTTLQAISLLQDLKLGHYMKIPPRSIFLVQVVSTVISSAASVGSSWLILSTVRNICEPTKLPKGSPWTCPMEDVVFDNTVQSGVVGPAHLFAPHGIYWWTYIFFALGILAPILVWKLSRHVSNKWVGLINIPVILSGGASMLPARPVHYWTWAAIGIFFNFYVYRKSKGWWAKYNYVLSAGLNIGPAFITLLLYFALNRQQIYGVNWWGLEVDDHCPLAHCPTAPGIEVDGCPVFH